MIFDNDEEEYRNSVSAAPFSPTDLSNLVLWSNIPNGDSITLGTSPDVTSLDDSHTSNTDFEQLTALNMPHLSTADQNSLDGLLYNSDFRMSAGNNANFNSLSAFTLVYVVKPTTVAGINELISKWTGSGNLRCFIVRLDGGDIRVFLSSNGTSSANAITSNGLSAGSAQVITIVYDGSGVSDSDKLKIFINDGSEESLTFSGTIPSSLSNVSSELIYGAINGTSNDMNATQYEVIFYSDAKSDISNLVTYAKNRWNI